MNNCSYPAARHLLSVLLLIISFSPVSAQTMKQVAITEDVNYAIGGYYEALPPEYATTPNKKYPLLIFIHGIGELGNGSQSSLPQLLLHGIPKVIHRNRFPAYFHVNNETFSFIVISPQYRRNHRDPETVQSLIDYCVKKYRVDESRIYLTGLSMGGGISWVYARTQGYSNRIAALLTVCGNTNSSTSGIANIAATNLPVWATHNQNDNVVPSYNSINWITGLNAYTPAMNPKSLLTIFPVSGHDAWSKTYNPDYKPNGVNVYEWMLSYKRKQPGTPENQLPVVNAGADKVITLPVASIALSGNASDPDGTIASYKWTKVSGPSSSSIINALLPNTVVSGLAQGTHVFRLTATDDRGGTSSDDVTVLVQPALNLAPGANAGADKAITLPLNHVQLAGSGSDADGTIQSYQWSKISGPAGSLIATPALPTTQISGLVEGTYVFRFTVTDDQSATAWDEMKITVHPAPVTNFVQARGDTLVYKNQTRPDSAFLTATATAGATVSWSKISGPGSVVFSSANTLHTIVTGLQAGQHRFKITANGTVSDTVVVDVRDWQMKGVTPCRPGGGKSFVVAAGSSSFFRPYINRDNVVGETVMGGDTLYFKGGTYTGLEIGDFGGAPGCPVYILPKDGAVIIKEGYFRIGTRDSNVVQHAILDGTILRSKGIPYGFVMDNSHLPLGAQTGSNLIAGWVAHVVIKGYRSYNTGMLQIKLDAKKEQYGRFDKFIQKRIVLTDNFINHSRTEGLYIGHTDPDGGQLGNTYGAPPRMDSVEISNNIVMNCGWDGIQLANSRNGNIIINNFVYKTGLLNQSSQRAGIILGGNSSGRIDSNVVINSQGTGIQSFGYGAITLNGNVIDSVRSNDDVHDGSYISFINTAPEINTPSSVFHIGNLVSRVSRSYIRVADNTNTMLPGSTTGNYFIHPTQTVASALIVDNANGTKANNKVVAHFPFHLNSISTSGAGAAISMTQGTATASFKDGGEVAAWLLDRLKTPAPQNILPLANAGANVTITLPLDSVELEGVATDSDGTVASTLWSKVSGPVSHHFTDSSAASTLVNSLVAGTYKFAFKVTDNDGGIGRDTLTVTVKTAQVAINLAPVVNAGTNKEITLPVDSINLSGAATDADGSIIAVRWKKISGPAQHSLSNDTDAQCMVTGMVAGLYYFEFRATDSEGASAADTVRVLVNACLPLPNTPPTAKAGRDTIIVLPKNSLNLAGTGTDGDGGTISYQWSKISGPASIAIVNNLAPQTLVKDLVEGTYHLALTVTDEVGASDRDTMVIMVLPAPTNKAPMVDAGREQTIVLPADSVLLTGSARDEDGTIKQYTWTKIKGPGGASIKAGSQMVTRVVKLLPGTYQFKLMVTDNEGAVGADIVTVIVKAPQQPMVVLNAGHDRVIPMPFDSVRLQSTALNPSNLRLQYQWTKISGPSSYDFVRADSSRTELTSLSEGRYMLQCAATDKFGIVYFDTVEVKVSGHEDSRMTLYPNPATTIVTIRVEANTKNAPSQLLVYNQVGKVMYAEQFTRTQAEAIRSIDISKFPPGVYMVEVSLDINRKQTTKLLKH